MGYRAIVLGLSAALCASAQAKLNEFSVADGYQSPFFTPTWTYNPLWSFDGGTLGGNYVAQHGYGAGFPVSEPFGLVIRNDNPSSAFQFSYAFEPFDLGGAAPGAVGGQTVQIAWDMNGYFGTGATATAPMLVMGFGGTRSNPRMRMGFSNQNKIMYSDAANNLIESPYVMNSGWWSRVALTMNFATSTYDLSVTTMTGNGLLASNTWTPLLTTNIVTAAPFFTPGGTLNNLWFDANVEPSNGAGLSKSLFDHFTGTLIPSPGGAVVLGAGALGLARRRRAARSR